MCINGENGHLLDTFHSAGAMSKCGKKRKAWQLKHGASDADFKDFAGSIAFQLGKNFTDEVKLQIGERMELLGMKHDDTALLVAVGIVKDWIKAKQKDITLAMLEEKLKKHDLYQPASSEKSAAVYFITVKGKRFELEPDYILDWQKYFVEVGGKGGHELIDKKGWNNTMLPELAGLEKKINGETGATLIRARGQARLSGWFAFGHTFSAVAGYHIEVDQLGKLWKTDAVPEPSFRVISQNGSGDVFSDTHKTVVVGISVTGNLEEDVRNYISANGAVDALLLLKPDRELGPGCFQSAADVVAFTLQVKDQLRAFVKTHKAEKLLLFYFGPLSGACFLGHQLNAVCNEIQIMENVPGGGYTSSFSLL
jgi:hypothetical protein